jgi:DNA-binding transcriptional regulator YiaG
MAKKIKKFIESYEYLELGFPIILKDVAIVQDRDYEYALINHKEVMNKAAFNLVIKHENLDGARLKFLRRFINYSLDEMADLIDMPKSTLHNWEKDSGKPLEMPSEKLKCIFLKVRDILAKEISDKLERAILKDIVVTKKMSPLEIFPL